MSWFVGVWRRINELAELLCLDTHMAQSFLKLLLDSVTSNPWRLFGLRTVSLLFCEGHCLLLLVYFGLILLGTWIALHSLVLDLASLGPIVYDIPISPWQMRIVFIR